MNRYSRQHQSISRTLRVLAHLLSYPDETLRRHLDDLRQALLDEAAVGASRSEEILALIDRLSHAPALVVEARYVELFDRGRATSLHLFEHVHGDSRDRGPAMIDLVKTYEEAGLYLQDGELPDYLPVVLQYASTQPPAQAIQFLGEIAHIVRVIFSALLKRESRYASVLASVLDLAGEKVCSVSIPDEPDIDDDWAEPAAFDGCSNLGQTAPSAKGEPGGGQYSPAQKVQPVHFVARRQNPPASPVRETIR